MLEDRLSEDLLRGKFHAGDTVVVDLEGEELVVRSGEAVGALSAEDK
jgi:ATP-dependent Clp protease ATP-binding subunit ClpC